MVIKGCLFGVFSALMTFKLQSKRFNFSLVLNCNVFVVFPSISMISELSKNCKGARAAEGKRISIFSDTSSDINPIQDVYFANEKDPEQYKTKFGAFYL